MLLLEHFKELTLNPNNAEELKGLILQLAIEGKLTSTWRKENRNIEPSSVLLKRIGLEKEQFVIEKKIKKEKPLPLIDKKEIPYELPENWDWARLGEVSTLINGDRGKNYPSKSHYINAGIPFITARNLGDVYLKHEHLNYISQAKYDLLNSGQIKTNDILYCLRGSLGKCSIVEGINEGAIASSLVIVRMYSQVHPFFVLNYLKSPLGIKMIYKYDNGTAQPNLSATDLKTYLIPVPPKEEQKQIVKTVIQLFTEVEQLENLTKERIQIKKDFATSALQRLTEENTKQEWSFIQKHFKTFFNEKANIKKLRESILQLAVQGKLTANWRTQNPNQEPASELLKRIKTEKEQLVKEKKIKKEKPLTNISDKEKPFELPETWRWKRLGEVATLKSGTTFNKSLELESGDFKYVKVGAMNLPGNEDVITTSNLYVNSNDKIDRALIPERSIIFPKRGGAIATNKKRIVLEPILVDLNTMAITCPKGLEFMYMRHWFSTIDLWKLNNGTSVPQINNKDVAPLLIGIPPLKEQKVIVEKVNSLMGLCDKLEREVVKGEEGIEKLMKSVLGEVFNKDKV